MRQSFGLQADGYSGVALVSPLTWSYHYLSAMAFAPVLLARLGNITDSFILLAVFIPVVWPTLFFYQSISMRVDVLTTIGTVSAVGFFLSLAFAYQKAPSHLRPGTL